MGGELLVAYEIAKTGSSWYGKSWRRKVRLIRRESKLAKQTNPYLF